MRAFDLKIPVLFFILFLSTPVFAVTAYPDPVVYQQPDGSILTLLMKGDEWIHWAETPDGFTLLSDPSGRYVYAVRDHAGNMVLSSVQANDSAIRNEAEKKFLQTLEKKLFFSETQLREMKSWYKNGGNPSDAPMTGGFPTTGTRKLLMILANFSDTPTTFTQANFINYMNQINYNGTGSFRDYYLEVSYGQLTVNTTVTVWVTLPNTHNYYGPQAKWGEFAHDAVLAANTQAGVNYADFDNNADGVVDGVAIIHQGRGQEESGNINDIWSHSWDLNSAGFPTTLDGVSVSPYTTMPEKANATSMGTIGVMCHEFGHNLGAPDFYDVNYGTNGQYDGTGDWDVMAQGSWNGFTLAGDKPAHHNAWTKIFYGWSASVLAGSGTYTLRNAQVYPDILRYNTATSNEYFLCENRQKTGFDIGIPGHGMIIYHVDGSYINAHSGSNGNDINAGSHQGLYPMSATSTTASGIMLTSGSTINTSGCPWPGTANKTTFTDATTPNSKSWAGVNTGIPLTNIVEDVGAKIITLCVLSCSSPLDPQTFTATAVSSSQINLLWTQNSSSNPVMVAFSSTPTFGTPVNGTSYVAGNAITGGGTVLYNGSNTSFNHINLTVNTTYYYKAWSLLPGTAYSPGVTTVATTFCGAITVLPFSEGFEASATTPACWSEENANPSWLYITGAGQGFPVAAHTGTRNACLKDQSPTDNLNKLITPVFDLSGYATVQLTFWHTQALWTPDQDELKIYYRNSNGGAWNLLQSYLSNITTWTQETIVLPSLTSYYQVGFEGNAKYGYGVCIDDISLQIPGTWLGGISGTPNNWNVAGNWGDGVVPTSGTNVYIPLRLNQPIVTAGATCNDLTIEAGAGIIINAGIQLIVNGNVLVK